MLTNRVNKLLETAHNYLVCSPSKPVLSLVKSLGIAMPLALFVMFIGLAHPQPAQAELYEGMQINWINDNGIDCHKPANYNSSTISWTAKITNNNADGVYIETAVFHDPKSGCGATTHTLKNNLLSVTGQTNYPSGSTGQTTFSYNTTALTCGRVQVDAAYRNSNGNGDGLVFLGEVIDYGVDCQTPIVDTQCVDNAILMTTKMIPSKVQPGQSVPFDVQIFNTGTSWYYHGSYYQLHQKTNLNINPPYGHLEPSIHSGQEQIKNFTLTAPTAPGTYTISFQMYHKAGTQLLNDNGQVCAPAPSNDIYFGSTLSMTFTVEQPTVVPNGIVVVLTNIPTSWVITGPNNFNGSGTYGSYSTLVGNYSITNVPATLVWGGSNYQLDVINPNTQTLSASGSVIFSVHYSAVTTVNTPTITSGGNQTCSLINLKWTDNANNETGYFVYRSVTGGTNLANYTRVAQLSANANSYVDRPALNQSYYYIVSAYINSPAQQVNSQPYLSALNIPCTSNIEATIKILAVNGNSQFTVASIKNTDVLTIEILVDNLGPASAYISNISNTLGENLTSTRNLQATGPNILVGSPSILGTGKTTTFSVSGRKEAGDNKWAIRFDTTVNAPASDIISIGNCSTINYLDDTGYKSKKVCLSQVLAGGTSRNSAGVQFNEVAP